MIKVLSLFSGIGAFEKALSRVGIDYELVNYCEVDKHASKSYSQIHNVSEDLNLWDVTTVDTSILPKDIDLLTHGSPCQSYSVSGKQEGGDKGSGTKSSLMWETVRIVEDVRPKIVIWENVKNVLSNKHKHNFDTYIESLNDLNYNSYYQVLNAKDYGVPQNRERIFVVSIRKDIDDGNFEFPNGFPLELKLKDVLDQIVDKKFYLRQKDANDIAMVLTNNNTDEKIIIDDLYKNRKIREYDKYSPSLRAERQGLKVVERPFTKVTAVAMRGRPNTDGKYDQKIEVSDREVANAITTVRKDSMIQDNSLIRYLTPKECFRLMGFDDEDYEKAAKFSSKTKLYKQAGNSIVVNVLEAIFRELRVYLEK